MAAPGGGYEAGDRSEGGLSMMMTVSREGEGGAVTTAVCREGEGEVGERGARCH
jgi:hypothetical protein